MKISNKKKTKIKTNEEIISGFYVEGGYMIMCVNYDNPNTKDNIGVYLCDTNGKNGKVINTFSIY